MSVSPFPPRGRVRKRHGTGQRQCSGGNGIEYIADGAAALASGAFRLPSPHLHRHRQNDRACRQGTPAGRFTAVQPAAGRAPAQMCERCGLLHAAARLNTPGRRRRPSKRKSARLIHKQNPPLRHSMPDAKRREKIEHPPRINRADVLYRLLIEYLRTGVVMRR